ncbi:MAG TPA: class I SAM-dependent methyltransferase [Ktedonosporobacter sp.]|nr:class I SAM-dependent methyltransferase [Ktedonosporobacter sp.]
MSTTQDQPGRQNDNTYVIDSESAVEMARLMRQDLLLTKGMGGLFPEDLDLTDVQRILDIACGPGGWVLETAFANADIDVVGVDISQKMITYANAQAQVRGLKNASFQVMNALQPIQFPDESFDLVNTRLIVAFMLPEIWPKFVQECLRILRPGGILRLTDLEWGLSNMPAYERTCDLFNMALHKAGQSFSPNGNHMGLLPMLRRFLSDAGCENIGRKAHAIEFSYGTEAHEGFYHDLAAAFKLLQPFIRKWEVATQEELDTLYRQTLAEMQSEDFCALWILLTVWGYKPRPTQL